MKKLSLLLLALVIAIGVQGAPVVKGARPFNQMKIQKEMTTKHKVVKGETARNHQFNNGPSRIISDQPEGEAFTYTRTGDCIARTSNGLGAGSETGTTTIVFAEDNKVYIKDILYGGPGTWVQGTIEGNTLTVPMGQSIYYDSGYDAYIDLVWGETYVYDNEGSPYIGFIPKDNVTAATYTIDSEAKTISLNGCEQPEVPEEYADYGRFYAAGLGCKWTDDDSFGGYLAVNTVFTENGPAITPTVITEQPEGQLITYNRFGGYIANSYNGYTTGEVDGKVNVVFADNGKVYIQNPLWWYNSSNTWVEGTYDLTTGIITVPTGQYISWNDNYGYGIRVGWGSTDVIEGEDEETGDPTYSLSYSISDNEYIHFMIENDQITLLGTEGDIDAEFPNNYIATGIMGYWSDDLKMTCLDFNQEWKIVDVNPAVPADPTADDWYDCGDESGFSKFYFTLPDKDTDGNLLDPYYLSYSVFIDNGNGAELFTFPAADYTFDLTDEDITEVPYSLYSDAVDFKNYFVYMYRTNAEGYEPLFTENIGIQAYYTVDGVRSASNIAWLYEIPVEEVLVHGVVVDPQGNKLEGVTVAFTPVVEEPGEGAPRRAEAVPVSTITDADGKFEATLAANSEYTLTLSLDDATKTLSIETEEEDIDLEEIVFEVVVTGINDLTANKQVASTTYFDMAGRQVSNPTDGVFVKSVRYTDGTVVTVKVIK